MAKASFIHHKGSRVLLTESNSDGVYSNFEVIAELLPIASNSALTTYELNVWLWYAIYEPSPIT